MTQPEPLSVEERANLILNGVTGASFRKNEMRKRIIRELKDHEASVRRGIIEIVDNLNSFNGMGVCKTCRYVIVEKLNSQLSPTGKEE